MDKKIFIVAKREYFDGRDQCIHSLQRFLASQEEAERFVASVVDRFARHLYFVGAST